MTDQAALKRRIEEFGEIRYFAPVAQADPEEHQDENPLVIANPERVDARVRALEARMNGPQLVNEERPVRIERVVPRRINFNPDTPVKRKN